MFLGFSEAYFTDIWSELTRGLQGFDDFIGMFVKVFLRLWILSISVL